MTSPETTPQPDQTPTFEDMVKEAFGLTPYDPTHTWHGAHKTDEQAEADAVSIVVEAHQAALQKAEREARIDERKRLAKIVRDTAAGISLIPDPDIGLSEDFVMAEQQLIRLVGQVDHFSHMGHAVTGAGTNDATCSNCDYPVGSLLAQLTDTNNAQEETPDAK